MKKIFNLKQLVSTRKLWKQKKEKVVFTNGVFDILHSGHVSYLKKAASLGTKLIVAINSDSSVKKIKGPLRPINFQNERAFIISELGFVSAVVIFNEETPIKLIQKLIPDILVKGGDWKIEKIVGKEVVEKNGGKVKTIKFVANKSTTNTIEKIIKNYSN